MTLRVCQGCTTAFADGLDVCPNCGSADHIEQGEDMPKSTLHGGASNAADEFAVDTDTQGPSNPDEENDDEWRSADDTEGDDESWPGNSSSPSTDKDAKSKRSSKLDAPSPAQTAESHSDKADGAQTSSARSTGGATRGTTSTRSDKK